MFLAKERKGEANRKRTSPGTSRKTKQRSDATNTDFNPSALLYSMRLNKSSQDEEKIDRRSKTILVRDQRRRQSQVLEASMQDVISTHVHVQQNGPGNQHTPAERDPNHSLSQKSGSANDGTMVALKAKVIQQATRIAELEAENRYLRMQIIEKQHQ
jgi:hypothetical protein